MGRVWLPNWRPDSVYKTHAERLLEMSDTPHYLPDNYLEPIENQLERAKAVSEARRGVLQPIQAIFVNHLFEANMDISTAASRTGVTVKTARNWVEQEGPVSELIGSRLEELAKSSKVTVEAIVERLWEEGTRMPIDSEDKTVSHAARVSALSHLAKFKGMFDKGSGTKKNRVSVNINVAGDAQIGVKGDD